MAKQWLDGVEEIRKLRNNGVLDGTNYCQVRYEDLIADPETEMRKVTSFLGVKFSSDMLFLEKSSEAYGDASGRTDIVASNRNKFLKELTESEIREIEEICYHEIEFCKYPIFYAKALRHVKSYEYLLWYLQDAVSIVRFRLHDEGIKGIRTQYILFKERLSSRIMKNKTKNV